MTPNPESYCQKCKPDKFSITVKLENERYCDGSPGCPMVQHSDMGGHYCGNGHGDLKEMWVGEESGIESADIDDLHDKLVEYHYLRPESCKQAAKEKQHDTERSV